MNICVRLGANKSHQSDGYASTGLNRYRAGISSAYFAEWKSPSGNIALVWVLLTTRRTA